MLKKKRQNRDLHSVSSSVKNDKKANSPTEEKTEEEVKKKERKEEIIIEEEEEKRMHELLQNVFKLNEFREGQKEIIKNLVFKKNDCFVVFPTGGGKSLTYQLSALLFKRGVTVVISPLIALMADQIKNLREKNILAETFNSSISSKKQNEILDDLNSESPDIRLLYIAPEQVSSNSFRSVLVSLHRRKLLNLFAVDEAHCISSWGHDFRKSYRNLGIIKEMFAGVPIIACTGTATAQVKRDIVDTLKLKNAQHVVLSFNRQNLYYQIKFIDIIEGDLMDDLTREIRKFSNECGIVYCFKKQTCDEVAEELRKRGVKARAYHAGLSNKTRDQIQQGWSADDIQVLVGTVAFGLGVDKKDVRFVIHHSIPKTIEGYYQESGRAGRDGKQAYCILYYSHRDYQKLEYIMKLQSREPQNFGRSNLNAEISALKKVKDYCESLECRRRFTLRHFGESVDEKTKILPSDFCCDFCFDKNHVFKNFQKLQVKLNSLQQIHRSNNSRYDDADVTAESYSLEFEKVDEEDSFASKKRKKEESGRSFFLSARELQSAKTREPHSHVSAEVKKKGLNAVLKELEKQEAEAEERESKKSNVSRGTFSSNFFERRKNAPLRFSGGLFAKKVKYNNPST